jgi:hypothetical protein
MRLPAFLLAVLAIGIPAAAFGQYGGQYRAPRSPSVLRQAGLWDNYMTVPDGHCGCPMPVECDNYANCCHGCNLNPCCMLRRFGRVLNALLPCNMCCGGGLLGCGRMGGCHGGCCYSDHYMGGPYMGGHSAGCPTCSSSVPDLGNPFEDDPTPPTPTPEPAVETDVHYHPAWNTPPRITRDPRPSSQARAASPWHRAAESARRQQAAATAPRKPAVAARPAVLSKANEQSVLRRTSLEGPAEPLEFEVPIAKPIPAASQDENSDYWAGVPVNPLRTK